jgi:two-component system phosphate regulon sensor histidine kinase PhoR
MRAQAGRMRNLLDDLLQLSKLQSAAHGSRQKVVDVRAIVESVCQNILALPECRQQFDIRINSSARLLGEESEIESVVSNLVSNAVRYTPPDGAITIAWDVDEDGGHLSVADTGIGIADEDISRITERFYRTDQGRARHKGGTGLGLAIVKHALRHHEAELEIQSRLGAGSTFTCHFPPHRLDLSSSAVSLAS